MTKRATGRTPRKPRAKAKPQSTVQYDQLLPPGEVWGLVLTAMGVITLVALTTNSQGKLSLAWSQLLRQGFGVGAHLVALALVLGGLMLLLRRSLPKAITFRWQTLVGVELLFFVGLGLVHVFTPLPAMQLAKTGRAGGYVGWAWAQFLVPMLGRPIAIIVLLVVWLFGLFLVLGKPWSIVFWRLRWVWASLGLACRRVFLGKQRPVTPPVSRPEPEAISRGKRKPPGKKSVPPKPRALPKPKRVSARITKPLEPGDLPSLELLELDAEDSGSDADTREREQVIEETLEAFGIPAKVVERHRGPVVTQFGIEPGYVERTERNGEVRRFKIRVSKILALHNDLALALAASPIRIEAPVPGRPIVGIEVPNAEKSMVGLRGVLESSECQKMHSPLRFALGRDVSGSPVVADLTKMPHLLIAGATGSGKSVCLNAIIASLLFHNRPEDLKLVMVDPKRVELTKYNGIPHLVAPVIVDVPKVIVALRWVTREMEGRYRQFAAVGARNVNGYNKRAKSRGMDTLPLMVVIIDELADLMLAAPDDVETTICRLAQMARATGIHLVIATQRPSVDVVTGLIKANFPARISFAVTSQIDSRVILDTPGAEKLLGRGDMLFMAPDSAKLQRIQGCFVAENEIDLLVRQWKQLSAGDGPIVLQPAPWVGMSLEKDPSRDDMIKRATDLVRDHEQASASFLQRRLRIGYPRAARLIDELEELGVVGPPESGGRSRMVLSPLDEEDGADGDGGETEGEEEMEA